MLNLIVQNLVIIVCLILTLYTHYECKKMYNDWIKELGKRDKNNKFKIY